MFVDLDLRSIATAVAVDGVGVVAAAADVAVVAEDEMIDHRVRTQVLFERRRHIFEAKWPSVH